MLVGVVWREELGRWAMMGQFGFQIKRHFYTFVCGRVREPLWYASPSVWVNTCRSTGMRRRLLPSSWLDVGYEHLCALRGCQPGPGSPRPFPHPFGSPPPPALVRASPPAALDSSGAPGSHAPAWLYRHRPLPTPPPALGAAAAATPALSVPPPSPPPPPTTTATG